MSRLSICATGRGHCTATAAEKLYFPPPFGALRHGKHVLSYRCLGQRHGAAWSKHVLGIPGFDTNAPWLRASSTSIICSACSRILLNHQIADLAERIVQRNRIGYLQPVKHTWRVEVAYLLEYILGRLRNRVTRLWTRGTPQFPNWRNYVHNSLVGIYNIGYPSVKH